MGISSDQVAVGAYYHFIPGGNIDRAERLDHNTGRCKSATQSQPDKMQFLRTCNMLKQWGLVGPAGLEPATDGL